MHRMVDVETDGRHLSVSRGFMVVAEGRQEVGRVPLDDIAAVLVHAHGVTWSVNLACALAERGAPIVFCGADHLPRSVCLPIDGHHEQNARMRAQWEAGRPLCKQMWRTLVVAKIRWQAAALEAAGVSATAFDLLARRVRSGDPDNIEAQVARRYWPLLFGAAFRRDRAAPGTNGLLNYGATVLRSCCARAVVASGLHPSIGVHHAHRGNSFALADDLIEPFRAMADALTFFLLARGFTEVGPPTKRAFARLMAFDLTTPEGVSPLAVVITRAAQGLGRAFTSGAAADFAVLAPPPALELRARLTTLAEEVAGAA